MNCDQRQDVITRITQMDEETMEGLQEIIEHINQTHLQGQDTSYQQELMKGLSVNDLSCSNLNISANNTTLQEIQNLTDDVNLSNASITPRSASNREGKKRDFEVRITQADLNGMENEKNRLRNTVGQLAEENKSLLLLQESVQRQLDDAKIKI